MEVLRLNRRFSMENPTGWGRCKDRHVRANTVLRLINRLCLRITLMSKFVAIEVDHTFLKNAECIFVVTHTTWRATTSEVHVPHGVCVCFVRACTIHHAIHYIHTPATRETRYFAKVWRENATALAHRTICRQPSQQFMNKQTKHDGNRNCNRKSSLKMHCLFTLSTFCPRNCDWFFFFLNIFFMFMRNRRLKTRKPWRRPVRQSNHLA